MMEKLLKMKNAKKRTDPKFANLLKKGPTPNSQKGKKKMKNILNKFTLRSLKLNIKRTIATCMGIIMSTALICAVAGVASSFQQTLINHTIELDGDYHVVFFNIC